MSPKETGPIGFLNRVLVQGATPRSMNGSGAASNGGLDGSGIDLTLRGAPILGPDGEMDTPSAASGGLAADAESMPVRQTTPTVRGAVVALPERSMDQTRTVTVDRIIPVPASRPTSQSTVQTGLALPVNQADAGPSWSLSRPDDPGRPAIDPDGVSDPPRGIDGISTVVIPGSGQRHSVLSNRDERPFEADAVAPSGQVGTQLVPGGEPDRAERRSPSLSSLSIPGSNRSSLVEVAMHPGEPEPTAHPALKETASGGLTRPVPLSSETNAGSETGKPAATPLVGAPALRGEVLQAPEVDTQSLTNIGRTRPDDPGTKRQLPPDGMSRHIADLERTVSALTEQVSALEARTRDHTRLTPQVATPKVPVHPKPQAPAPAAFWERNYLSRCYRWSRR